ncbi:MAG: DNA-processing protein DprA [Candidatus Jorgensenbacteria bacterium]
MPLQIKKINPEDKDFPPLLREIPGRPEQIFYMGSLPNVEEVMVAVVGTRKATSEGMRLAKEIGRDLAEKGITVISGLALGIDSAAHAGALSAGGKTIAVLGNGLDYIYPAQNQNLARKILENKGAIISEYSEGTPSYPNQFLERNRIISGLSLAVVVVEAPIKSGALATAKHALEQGREVFVVPGPAGHPNYEGSHMLLRNGARLVTSASEILEDLKGINPDFSIPAKSERTETARVSDRIQLVIFEAIREAREPLYVDNIVETTKLEPNVVNEKLTSLMLEGLIEEKNGKFKIRN